MLSMRFNALLDRSHCGTPHPFRDAGVVTVGLAGNCNMMVKCLFVVNRSCIHKDFLVSLTGKNP
jgi:hypothetical protein